MTSARAPRLRPARPDLASPGLPSGVARRAPLREHRHACRFLAATDGHAKNFSLFLLADGGYRLTPLYDVVSARPVMGRGPNLIEPRNARLAMAVRGASKHDRLTEIQRRHWNAVAKTCRLPGGAEPLILGLLDRVPRVVHEIAGALPPAFPSRVAEPILQGLLKAVEQMEAMPAE